MARTMVTNDDMSIRVEITEDAADPELLRTWCSGCGEIDGHESGFDTLNEAQQAASIHVDRCRDY